MVTQQVPRLFSADDQGAKTFHLCVCVRVCACVCARACAYVPVCEIYLDWFRQAECSKL